MPKGQIVQVKLCFYDESPYDRIAHVEYASGRVLHYSHDSFLDLPKTVKDFMLSDRSVIISQNNCRIRVNEGLITYIAIYRMRGFLSHGICFVNAHCSSDCPNAQIDYIDYVYGSGIASDMGLKVVKCKDCDFNTFLCEDCLLLNTPYCPDSVIGGVQ